MVSPGEDSLPLLFSCFLLTQRATDEHCRTYDITAARIVIGRSDLMIKSQNQGQTESTSEHPSDTKDKDLDEK